MRQSHSQSLIITLILLFSGAVCVGSQPSEAPQVAVVALQGKAFHGTKGDQPLVLRSSFDPSGHQFRHGHLSSMALVTNNHIAIETVGKARWAIKSIHLADEPLHNTMLPWTVEPFASQTELELTEGALTISASHLRDSSLITVHTPHGSVELRAFTGKITYSAGFLTLQVSEGRAKLRSPESKLSLRIHAGQQAEITTISSLYPERIRPTPLIESEEWLSSILRTDAFRQRVVFQENQAGNSRAIWLKWVENE